MDELRQNQLMQTEMLNSFHVFCKENNLRYYIIGGTAIGALRHQGFIPWDDDIDLGMPRKDYNKLISIYNSKKTNERYILESPYTKNKDYCYTFSKLYDSKTILIENNRHFFIRGISIDIFPIDGTGSSDNPVLLFFLLNALRNMVGLLGWPIPQKPMSISIIKRFIFFILCLFCGMRNLRILYDKLSQLYNYDKSTYAGNLHGMYGKKEIVDKTCFGVPTECQFEKIKVFALNNPQKYLKHVYNHWEELPPVEKRIHTHKNLVVTNKSFLDIASKETINNIRTC